MLISKWVFRIAGIYGLLALVPQYFMEQRIGINSPPAINHPEYFYGFLGVAIAWQFVFLIISTDPVRFRLLMLPSIIEKWSFTAATIVLTCGGRLAFPVLVFGLIDLVLGVLFLTSYLKSRS
jgi:hypothetical protein